ncbi:MAG TPA: hypothetical protein PKJ17_03365 [Syntrophorhabdaceae bacterium]|mgnify:FL=1|nr:hypothetical protein [Syntrophorhabdaceae bacterium]
MPVFDENGNQINTEEEFPKMKDPEEGLPPPAKKPFPILPAVLGIIALVLAVVAVVFFLKANTLEQEVEILKKAKTQLATTEAKLQDAMKENQKVKAELGQAKAELDSARAKNQALEDQLAKKKAPPATKKSPSQTDKKSVPKKPAPRKP